MSHTQELVLVESWVLETKLLIGNDYFHTYFFSIFSKETWKMIKKRGYGCCFINRKYSIWKYSIWAKVTLAWVHFSSGAVFHTTIGQMTQNHFWRQNSSGSWEFFDSKSVDLPSRELDKTRPKNATGTALQGFSAQWSRVCKTCCCLISLSLRLPLCSVVTHFSAMKGAFPLWF